MQIKAALEKYKIIGDYFVPDYERENEVLTEFKANNQNLSEQQTVELVDLLQSDIEISDKYFVADLLYLYDSFNRELYETLLITAIHYKDPSFNRIFLRPCLRVFGTKEVVDTLSDRFNQANIIERIGISNLVYWLRIYENGNVDKLDHTILKRANQTANLIELYHYKLCYGNKIKHGNNIPDNAEDLIKVIKGNKEYEELLFDKLGWTKNIQMLIENKGIKTDLFYVPPFTLNAGEIIIINLFNGAHFYETEMFLKDIFCGKTHHESAIIHKKMTFAEHFRESKFRDIFYPVTVGEYLKKNANPASPYASKIYETEWINKKIKANTLTGIPRRLLSLYTTLSNTNNIIFDLVGLGPDAAQETYKIVKEGVKKGGAAILLDGYDDMKNDCTKYIELQWAQA
ncbi:hypothetical protein [Chryseobacterium viscerum]|uniref:Uncharacterized protein n=1 Tax=Chryseobacterium viscerum TaxID=1037377 RepID=A0A5N4BP45_9FLAO|nr:hypothetical protein [Chryseobacterium viscerum]KAB1230181.1 hypothetical protein F8D52_13420 [Chryseobacterium viscerum]